MIDITRIQIPSLPTVKPRRLYVYTPRGYEESDARYPVLYMFDGHNVFYDSHATYGKSWGMREYLKRTKLPLILAAVECSHEGDERLSEYCPWDVDIPKVISFPGKGKLTMDWLVNDLKPMIDRAYRTLPDREHTMIAGSSMGGLMALYAAVEYNAVFSRAAALSPSIEVAPKRAAELVRSARLQKPTLIYTDLGSAETEEDPRPWAELFRTAAALSKAGAYTDARIIPGALHSEAYWEKRIPAFMDFLYPKDE